MNLMGKKKQEIFILAVAEAARCVVPVLARGRPTPANLTVSGRLKGLEAMHAAPRCTAIRIDAKPCTAVAMRGAKRCLKHGGRIEVPDHPHNVRRFMSGKMGKPGRQMVDSHSNKALWEAMTYPQRREVLSLVSEKTIRDADRLYLAARIWSEVKDRGAKAEQQFFNQFLRA